MTSRLADGSTLPDYTPGGSLHRLEGRGVYYPPAPDDLGTTRLRGTLPDAAAVGGRIEYTGRVNTYETNDAEFLADIWGVLHDYEPLTHALGIRLRTFIEDHVGADAVEALSLRSSARYENREASTREQADPLHVNRYAYGHTGV
ncbi:hypothetical protein [Microbacterium sp. 77mftsu3.1]|uniref:hypothetical protein n=1 Tax=Microbacterium sp. 77mftsu3.1 TaxID=1761802 RepID=UPI0003749D19|nr:hypothetical protein [Microbacterium sp. 77mftsu3.1]SDH34171.1 hypothetical protein SAMN04488590_3076 [Microbacterium sp. 77mftsu3.1]